MKLNGILGKGSGKLGSAVFAINGGAQIVREHNPRISNPKTQAQIEQRAKFKLLAQIAADLAPALFFKRKGLFNARNQFISANMPLCEYNNEEAQVSVPNLHLSPSNSYLPDVSATKSQGVYNCVLLEDVTTPLEGVFYIGVANQITRDNKSRLKVVGVELAENPREGNFGYDAHWDYIDYVFAVGVKKKMNGVKKLVYDDYSVSHGTSLAHLGLFLEGIEISSYFTQSKGAVAVNG